MSKLRKASGGMLAAGAALVALTLPAAFAGSGGDTTGILYGEDDAYCDVQGGVLAKTDSVSGLPLAGATFTLEQPASTSISPTAVKFYTHEPDTAEISLIRKKWAAKFDQHLGVIYRGSSYGKQWTLASMKTPDSTKSTVPVEEALFPADITGVGATNQDATVRSAALASWPHMAAPASGTTVDEFFATIKTRLDQEGAVVVKDYNPNSPVDAKAGENIHPLLVGTDSEKAAVGEYNSTLKEFKTLLAALHAAGYPKASWNDKNELTGVAATDFEVKEQKWDVFVKEYSALVAPSAYPFGLKAPTYDLIFHAVGVEGVTTAERVAASEVGITSEANGNTGALLSEGKKITAKSGRDGKIYYIVFGRSMTAVNNTVARDCTHLGLVVTEVTAPEGYSIDDPAGVLVTPAALENEVARYEFTDTLKSVSSKTAQPPAPVFDAGM